jgi:DNA-binding transcriptional regulator YbjK
MLDTNPDAEPLLREVRNAKIAKGALQIQLDDLLEHCPEARARKEVVEKAMELHRKRHGSWPSLWGHGVNTAELKRQVAALTAELEKGAGTSPETVSTVQGLKAQAGPRYAVKSVAKLPFTTEQAKLSPETVESRRRKLAVKRLAAFLKIPKDVGAITTEEIEWQVAMHEKHGADAAKWPKVEVERHYKSPKFRKSLKNRNTAN